MDPILQSLNQAQRAAVTSPASVLQILAPPGSGKTKTLTSRVAYLLSHHHYKPWNIVCLTFTTKSAREMKERIAGIFDDGLEKRLILGTFHSVCRRYLASYGHLIGIWKGFGIADSSDSLGIIKRLVKRLRLNLDPKKTQSRISSSKSKGLTLQALNGKPTERNVEQQEFAVIFEAYQRQLEKSNLLDYDDLLLRCADLLRCHPSCVSNVEAVLIDEFQDTNRVQFELMQLFASKQKRITIVGDPDQSIYGWRAAETKNLKRMQEQYADNLVINLEDNYRSSGAILHTASEVIEQDEARPQKSLLPTHGYGTIPVLRKLPSPEIEAAWIVSEIQRTEALTGNLLVHADFAILLRYAALSRPIEAALGKAGISYRMIGGQRFFDREEVKVLLGYLRVISQPSNNDALSYIMDKPPRGAGVTTVKTLLEEAESTGKTMWVLIRDAVRGHYKPKTRLSKAAEQGLSELINVILTVRGKVVDTSNPQSPKDTLEHLLQKVDIEGWLKKNHEEDFEGLWANVEELRAQAAHFSIDTADISSEEDLLPEIANVEQARANPSEEALSKFLANVALATEIQREDEKVEGEAKPQSRVTISTIHAAKGLEWPVVFVPSVYQGSIPLSRAEDHSEERRLLYVAMTRAQALLFMSYPLKNPQREETAISNFLAPKKILKTLSEKGPSYSLSTVQNIARILRRQCPTEAATFEGYGKVESQEDDLWPLNGEEDPEVSERRWNKGRDSYHAVNLGISYKRRKLESTVSIVSASTTMQNTASFTVQNSSTAFTTATSELHRLEEEQLAEVTRASFETTKPKIKSNGKAGKVSANQASIKSLWGPKTPKLPAIMQAAPACQPEDPHPPTVRSGVSSELRLAQTSSIQHIAPPSRPSLAPIPPNLSTHTLQPRHNFRRPKLVSDDDEENRIPKPYIFFSSSPPRCLEEGEEDEKKEEDKREQVVDVKPATTFHTTTVSQLQNLSSTTGGSNMMARKTLGVKRSMAGWQAGREERRKGFSIPRKVMQKENG